MRRWPEKGAVRAIDEGNMLPGEEDGIFSTILKCSNHACYQGVAVLGDYSSTRIEPEQYAEVEYTVRDIYPAIHLIDISTNVTKPIAEALKRSFGLYWRDPQACAGAIRTAIEGVCDYLGQPARQNGKVVSLGNRLGKLSATHDHLFKSFDVIRDTVGNAGAHGDTIDREKLLTAYELLEIELRSLFNDNSSRRRNLIGKLQKQ